MMAFRATSAALLTGVVGIGGAVDAHAADGRLTGDWGGLRTRMEQAGLDLEVGHTSEIAYNAAGGTHELVEYADQWAFVAALDLQRLLDIHDARIKLTITERNGHNLSDEAHLGTLQQVQEVFGRGQDWRLTQLWYEQA